MKTILCSAMVLAIAGTLYAGPESIIKQRAKNIRDENNAQQGVPPPANPAPAPKPAQGVPVIATPSQQSLGRFLADLAAIKQGEKLAITQKEKLARDLTGAAQSNKPAATTVDRFVTTLHAALSAHPLAAPARSKLVIDLDAILNPSKYPQAKTDAIFEDIRTILQTAGTGSIEAGDIAATARVLAADVRKTQ